MAGGLFSSPRRLLAGSLVLGLFVLLDLGLFGWLIFRSLSQREIERVLLETREEAEGLAERIAGRAGRDGQDLYTAVALERETQTYIDSVLRQRDIVQTVEIRDRHGRLVFQGRSEALIPLAPADEPRLSPREIPPQVEKQTFERQSTYDVTVPIGDLGMIRIGISEGELEERIGALRVELLRQASVIAVVTLVLIVGAYVAIWALVRRGRRLEEQAAEAERMAAIGTLASGLAHEIRNPLNSLNLNMQLLEEEAEERDLGSGPRRLLSLTRAEISRLERLVTDFLSYARPRPLELEEVAPAELLRRCRDVLLAQAQARGVRVEVEDEAVGSAVRVDPGQMGQLLLNLAQNALAATEGTGRPGRIRLAARREGARVALAVEDNGAGIAPEEQGRVFDVFYSTRKGGTGLGLAIVRRIARAHGAELELESMPGDGTSVRVVLPAAAPVRGRLSLPQSSLEPTA